MKKLLNFFENNNIEYSLDVSLKSISTFKVGGNADIICYPENSMQVSQIVKFCTSNKIKYYTFGKCSNVVFSDNGIPTLIIKTDKLNTLYFDGEYFQFGAGVMLAKASKFTIDSGFKGMEFAYGIPGSIGGAVYMNAGAYGGEMSYYVYKTEYVDEKGQICILKKEDHDFSPRHSFFSDKNCIITKTCISLEKGDQDVSWSMVDEFQNARKSKQPLDFPSAGSVFKRPEGYFAGKLIQDCDLKGVSVGGAMVSEKHSGFIINYNGNATSKDIKDLVELIKTSVFNKFGVTLECEIKFID